MLMTLVIFLSGSNIDTFNYKLNTDLQHLHDSWFMILLLTHILLIVTMSKF